MSEQIILRAYQKTDQKALENVVREAWRYDRFCSPKTAAKMAKVYLNSCLTNQTFTRVAEIDGEPVGIIWGKIFRTINAPFPCVSSGYNQSFRFTYPERGGKSLKYLSVCRGLIKSCFPRAIKNTKGSWRFSL